MLDKWLISMDRGNGQQAIKYRLYQVIDKQVEVVDAKVLQEYAKGGEIFNLCLDDGILNAIDFSMADLPYLLLSKPYKQSKLLIIKDMGLGQYQLVDFKGQISYMRQIEAIKYASTEGIINLDIENTLKTNGLTLQTLQSKLDQEIILVRRKVSSPKNPTLLKQSLEFPKAASASATAGSDRARQQAERAARLGGLGLRASQLAQSMAPSSDIDVTSRSRSLENQPYVIKDGVLVSVNRFTLQEQRAVGIPIGVKQIATDAFKNLVESHKISARAPINEIQFSTTVTQLQSYALRGVVAKQVVLGKEVRVLEPNAIAKCVINRLVLPDTLLELPKQGISGTAKIKEIEVPIQFRYNPQTFPMQAKLIRRKAPLKD